jgi:hypothetical protein
MVHRANNRKQFGKTLGEFELVQSKLAEAAADTYSMESATYHTAALIDSNSSDYMVETAMLKVFASDALWRIVNDTLQIWGGAGFFTDQPFERMMRDARLNQIGEGANDVLRCFIAMIGFRGLGEQLQAILKRPWTVHQMLRFAPAVPCEHARLQPLARQLGKQIASFTWAAQRSLIRYRESVLDRQYVQAALADVATELFTSSCVYSRLCLLLKNTQMDQQQRERELQTGVMAMKLAFRRNQHRLHTLKSNDDDARTATAKQWLALETT